MLKEKLEEKQNVTVFHVKCLFHGNDVCSLLFNKVLS